MSAGIPYECHYQAQPFIVDNAYRETGTGSKAGKRGKTPFKVTGLQDKASRTHRLVFITDQLDQGQSYYYTPNLQRENKDTVKARE